MTGDERPDPLLRLDSTSEAIAGLRDLFESEEPLDEVLDRVASTAAKAIPDADAVTITVLNADDARIAACTDDRIRVLDQLQQQLGQGPCIDAGLERKPVRVGIGEARRWPEFANAAGKLGVKACLSVPLLVGEEGSELLGSLNVFSYSASAFDPFDEGLMRLYTVAASQAIANARRWQDSRNTVAQLERALTSRAEIDQAKGALMAIHRCTAEEAFQRLVQESQQRNTKLIEIARELLQHVQG